MEVVASPVTGENRYVRDLNAKRMEMMNLMHTGRDLTGVTEARTKHKADMIAPRRKNIEKWKQDIAANETFNKNDKAELHKLKSPGDDTKIDLINTRLRKRNADISDLQENILLEEYTISEDEKFGVTPDDIKFIAALIEYACRACMAMVESTIEINGHTEEKNSLFVYANVIANFDIQSASIGYITDICSKMISAWRKHETFNAVMKAHFAAKLKKAREKIAAIAESDPDHAKLQIIKNTLDAGLSMFNPEASLEDAIVMYEFFELSRGYDTNTWNKMAVSITSPLSSPVTIASSIPYPRPSVSPSTLVTHTAPLQFSYKEDTSVILRKLKLYRGYPTPKPELKFERPLIE